MEEAIAKIEEVVSAHTGTVVVKMKVTSYCLALIVTNPIINLQPRVVSQTDEADLAQLMSKMELENREIAADDEDDGGVGGDQAVPDETEEQ